VQKRVALATYQLAPALAPDDIPLAPALAALGVSAEAAVWSDHRVDWRQVDGVVIRSCWDYHRRIAEFREWLNRLESLGVPVWNSPSLVRWNADKRYLLDLASRGIATVPTMIAAGPAVARDVEEIAMAQGWSRIVVKPAISASGQDTYALRTPFDDGARIKIESAAIGGSLLVQPFADEVARDGEFSFTFIDGVLSHATLKRAAAGEFRVQTDHGGSVEHVDAPEELAHQAHRVLGALPEAPLYARVDGISRGGAFLLMELELIEPNLFLGFSPGAVERFAEAIRVRLELS
jgi:glutathione synthase/RimK-type ligase-like ATP-grasp enzyme